MKVLLQIYKRSFFTLLAVFTSCALFSNNSESFSPENNCVYIAEATVTTGIENIHITTSATAEMGTIYIGNETVFYSKDTITAQVVYLSAAARAPRHHNQVVSNHSKNQSKTIARQAALSSLRDNPFSGSSKNQSLFSVDTTFILPFAGKHSKKNTTVYPVVSLYAMLHDNFFDDVVVQKNGMYYRFGLQHASNIKATLFTRPPPLAVGVL